ncbi:MAG: hypothetical protein Q8N91_07130, partial [Candidatus Omnitrophota bacterium]|nr:hypothetical protein [Candidatus Omnitrophota bacterium]
VGGVVALVGLIGLISWWFDFIVLLKGCVPAMMIFGGLIAVIAGISEMKDEAASKKEEIKK